MKVVACCCSLKFVAKGCSLLSQEKLRWFSNLWRRGVLCCRRKSCGGSQIRGEGVFFVVAGKAVVVLKFVAKGVSSKSQEKL